MKYLPLSLASLASVALFAGGFFVFKASASEYVPMFTPQRSHDVVAGSRLSPWAKFVATTGETVIINLMLVQCAVPKSKGTFIFISPDKGFHVTTPMKDVWKMIGRASGK